MREIKFRVWEEDIKQMFYNVGIVNDELYLMLDGVGFDVVGDYREFKLMQYTGLKDKNGKEIYEGDIVRGKYGKNGIVKNYEIRWLIGHFAAVDRNNITGDEHYYPIGLLEGEVIGNIFQDGDLLCDSQSPDRNKIYENPELLGGEKHD